jgi:DNA (cytosine-5)-methyltransferase 1
LLKAMKVAGLFAGIGGIELGFERSGDFTTEFLCEVWAPARAVLSERFGHGPGDIAEDVTSVESVPRVDVLTAGFPCTDLSQAGRTAGITGEASGLVAHVFRLLRTAKGEGNLPTWLVIENVSNMLHLGRGHAMRHLVDEIEVLGMRWAYRVVDSRFTGVPQRRRRVILVASATDDPRAVLFADDDGSRTDHAYNADAFGFYWTEGLRGLGWAQDAIPTLKGGSTVGIPSPPAIWAPGAEISRRLVMPGIQDAEELQGFPRGWTRAAETRRSNGPRWKLVGNAVTVGVAEWLGARLTDPGDWTDDGELHDAARRWPAAAGGSDGKVHAMHVSEFPVLREYRHLAELVDLPNARPVSTRGAAGFWSRLQRSNLGRYPGFRDDVDEYVVASAAAAS